MGQDQSSVFDLAAVAAASNGGNNDPLLPPARSICSADWALRRLIHESCK